MGRRVRPSEPETNGAIDEMIDAEGQSEAAMEESARAARAAGGEAESKRSVQVTLSEEIAWRLGVVARMEGKAPGELVEPLIKGYLRAVRLPYDRYRRGRAGVGESQAPVSAN